MAADCHLLMAAAIFLMSGKWCNFAPMKDFEVRQYGRTELAQLYSPNITPEAAWKKLKLWIDHFPGLNQQLRTLGYRKRQRIFTPAQVRAIAEAIGEP